jgi:uncharacterized protein (DUF362 family)
MVQSEKANANDLTQEDITKLVREAVELAGGMDDIITDGDTVVLKPNFMSITDTSGSLLSALGKIAGDPHAPENLLPKEVNGVTTDYRVTKAVSEIVRELNPNGKIYVMEGSGSGLTSEKYELMGYTKKNIPEVDEFISLDDSGKDYATTGGNDLLAVDIGEYGLYDFTESLTFAKDYYYFDKKFYEADVLISLPVLKNHQMASITGSIKNVAIGATPPGLYGANPFTGGGEGEPGRGTIDHSWEPLNNWIHDYYVAKPIDFTVTDGLQSMEMGPMAMGAESMEDVLKNKRVILAGKDAVAVDTVHGLFTGVDTLKVKYLQDLGKDKAGITDTSRINVIGNVQLVDVKEVYRYPGAPYSWMNPVPKTNTYSDLEAPKVKVSSFEINQGLIEASFSSDENVVKVDIYVEGEFADSVKQSGTDLSIYYENSMITEESNVQIFAYDKYLNGVQLMG